MTAVKKSINGLTPEECAPSISMMSDRDFLAFKLIQVFKLDFKKFTLLQPLNRAVGVGDNSHNVISLETS